MDKHHLKRQLLIGYIRYKRNFPHIKLAISAVVVVILLSLMLLLRVASHELPKSWVEGIERELSTDFFSVELEGVSISLSSGLYLDSVAVYPKRVVHEPIVVARQVHMEVDFFSRKPLANRVRSVSIDSFELSSLDKDEIGYDETGIQEKADEEFTILPNVKSVGFSCRRARIFKTEAYNIDANISMGKSNVSCDNVVLAFNDVGESIQQNITGKVKYDIVEKSLEFSGSGNLKSETIIPLFEEFNIKAIVKELKKIEFPNEAPNISASVKISPNEAIYNFDMDVESGHVIYNGIDFVSMDMELNSNGTNGWTNVDINSLIGRRPEGVLSGSVFIDLAEKTLKYNANSRIRPSHLFTAIGVLKNENKFPLTVELPCQITANGCVGISTNTLEALSLEGDINARSISFNGVMFEDVTGLATMSYDSWDIKDIKAKCYDGDLNGDICFTPSYKNDYTLALNGVNFAADFNCKNSNLDTIVRSFSTSANEETPYSGNVNYNGYVNFDITGRKDDLRTMVGAVKLDITDAMIYRIPMFAGFTDFMARNVPGLDFILTQSSLKTELIIKDYGIRFDDLVINGPAISITGYGNLWFTGHMDAHMRANLLSQETWVGIGLRYILFPITKMFELQVFGPLKDLKWSTSKLGISDRVTTPEQRGEIQ